MELQKANSTRTKCLTTLAVMALCVVNSNPLTANPQNIAMALLSTAAIIYFVSRIINFRTAIMAALTFSTTLAFIRFSQSVQTNMALTPLITISPWIAILPMALITPFQKAWQQKRTPVIILWTWFILALVCDYAKPLKTPHMILTVIPPITILIGMVLEDLIFTQKVYSKRFATIFFQYHITAVLFGAIGATAFASGKAPDLLPQFITLMVITLTLAATIVLLFMKKMRIAATAVIFASVSLLAITVLTLLAS